MNFIDEVLPILTEQEIKISGKCCYWLKKEPMERYVVHNNKLLTIRGIRASESRLRKLNYVRNTCFHYSDSIKTYVLEPLSIWTDEDIWDYIRKNNIKYPDLYDKEFNRNGCLICGFGCIAPNGINSFRTTEKYYPTIYKKIIKKFQYDKLLSIVDPWIRSQSIPHSSFGIWDGLK